MTTIRFIRAATAALPLAVASLPAAAVEPAAAGAGLTVTTVELDGGRLVVKGTARAAGSTIRILGTSLTTKSVADKSFSFDTAFRPDDCRLTLKTAAGTLPLLVGNCGPKGDVGAKGPKGDRGAVGPAGPSGRPGADGKDGAAGPQGPIGPQGLPGIDGVQGPIGPEGPRGSDGLTGPQGPQGPAGPQGPEGTFGSTLVGVRLARDGSITRSSLADVTSQKSDVGVYTVTFPFDITTCYPSANVDFGNGRGQIRVFANGNTGFKIETQADKAEALDKTFPLADRPFHLLVFCP